MTFRPSPSTKRGIPPLGMPRGSLQPSPHTLLMTGSLMYLKRKFWSSLLLPSNSITTLPWVISCDPVVRQEATLLLVLKIKQATKLHILSSCESYNNSFYFVDMDFAMQSDMQCLVTVLCYKYIPMQIEQRLIMFDFRNPYQNTRLSLSY